jgi:WD40 repeat protein
LATLKGHRHIVRSVAFSPDGKTLASGSEDESIKLWDVATRKELATINARTGRVFSAVFCLMFSPDGKILASGGHNRLVRLWDPVTRKERATLKGHTGPVWCVAFTPNGKTLASGSWLAEAMLWDVRAVTKADR